MPVLTRKEHVAVVDAYSGGRNLIPAFQSLGYPVVHVQSGAPGYFAEDNELARERADRHVRAADHSEDRLVATLRDARVRVVLAGTESGVLLADRLAHRLDLPFRNDITSSVSRRDKFEMQERLREAGLASIPQARVETVRELESWLDRDGTYPVVVKPLRSAGTDGVHVCHTREQAVEAAAEVLGRADMFGNVNQAVLCQSFLVGDEYVMNGVACAGEYVFTEGWRSNKVDNNGFRVYDTQYLFCAEDSGFGPMSDYVSRVCRALGITNGPFHAEVMLTADGPILIEIGARIAGGADPYVIETCLGLSQVKCLVDASLQPESFLRSRASAPRATPARRAAYVFLVAPVGGEVRKVTLDRFFDVDGVLLADYHYDVGDYQRPTRDLLTAAGVVMVTAEDRRRLDAAVEEIRRIEAEMYAENIVVREGG